ncbi:MAG: heparinase II/III family protein [Armatimonadetes bacterium]|nr:heparinase II/III family protein [Armatimonadota bacterium]
MRVMMVLTMIMCVGSFAAAAGPEGMRAAPEPEVVWPQEWTAFGPHTIKRMGREGEPMAADLLPGDALKTIPKELVIGDRRFPGRTVRLEDGGLDLARLTPAGTPLAARTFYLMAPVTAAADTTIRIGSGADWWMQWWVDGGPVCSTLGKCGNGSFPITGRDHVFDVALTRGSHTVAVAVTSENERGFALAITSPQELRAHRLSFQEAMEAGKRHYTRPDWSVPLDLAGAHLDFREALKAAATDEERAEALLAAGENDLRDIENLGAAKAGAIRQAFAAAEALRGAQAGQKARAALGVGETWLLDNNCAQARREFARARALSDQPGWAPVVQFAVARSYLQERNNAAARKELAQLAARTDLDPALEFDVRLHLEALDVGPQIRPDHPRLFFNADTWPGVKARVEADAGTFRRLLDEAQGLPDEFEVRDWGGRQYIGGRYHPDLMSAALVYRVTRNPALREKIRKMLRATVDHYLARADYNAGVGTRMNCLAALDWVWNDLPPAERQALAHDLLVHAYSRHVHDMLTGVRMANRDAYYYMPMMHWYVGLATLDQGMDPEDYMRALAEIGRGYDNHVVASFDQRLEVMKDRGRVTRVDYAFKDLPTPCWTFLHCWQSAIGPIPDKWAFASGIAPSCVLRDTLGFARIQGRGEPGCFRHFGYGHCWNPKDGWTGGSLLYDNLGQFIYFFAKTQPEEAAIAAYLRKEMDEAGCTGEGHYLILPYVMDLSGSPAPSLPQGLPIARCYPTNGLVLMSSGFDPKASTYALYSCGGGAPASSVTPGAEDYDAGHFTLFKKGYLAIDSGTRAQWADPRPEGAGNYAFQSVAHNTVLIAMPGEVMPRQWGEPVINTGGQCQLPRFATVLAFETQPLFAYAATDATATYHPDKCARMVRQFLYLPPNHFVVFDRVVSKKAEYPKTWLLHTGNEPAITGKEFRADQEKGRIFCRTLYPLDAVLGKIGGPGKEFWADGRNWPIPDYSPYVGPYMNMANAADVPETVGRWRVEVTPGAARAEDCFLHLIQVSDQTVERMVESKVAERAGRIELAFTANGRAYTIALSNTGEVGGQIRIAEGGGVLVDRPLTQEVMEQRGLALTPGK